MIAVEPTVKMTDVMETSPESPPSRPMAVEITSEISQNSPMAVDTSANEDPRTISVRDRVKGNFNGSDISQKLNSPNTMGFRTGFILKEKANNHSKPLQISGPVLPPQDGPEQMMINEEENITPKEPKIAGSKQKINFAQQLEKE